MISLKVGGGLVAALLLFVAGWVARGKETQILDRPITKIETQKEIQTQVQVVDHVITKTKTVVHVVHDKAGDATTTTDVTKDTTGTVVKDSDTKSDTVSQVTAPSPSTYSLGLSWQPRIDPKVYVPSSVDFGYRAAGPLWVTAGFNWYDHSSAIGLRIEL